jgi:hypothetical protein
MVFHWYTLALIVSCIIAQVVHGATLRGELRVSTDERPQFKPVRTLPGFSKGLGKVPVLQSTIVAGDDGIRSVVLKSIHAGIKGGMYGGMSGLIQVITLMWMRTTVNYQYRYGGTLLSSLKQLYKQGGIMRFYNGWMYAVILGPISKFGAIAANEAAKVIVAAMSKDDATSLLSRQHEQVYATLLGTLLTVLWRVFLMPLETCKTVLQVDGTKGFDRLLARVMKGQVSALYQGTAASIVAIAASHYPWFCTYNFLDSVIVAQSDKVVEVVLRSAFIGFVSSAVSDTVSNSLRVLKTVKQSATMDGTNSLTYLQIVRIVHSEGGLLALFGRGLDTRIVTNGIQSILFTVLLKILPMFW